MLNVNTQKNSSKLLWIIFLTIFIDMLGVGVLIPVFPLLIIKGSEFNIVPMGWNNSQAMIMAGWLLAIYPLSQFIFTPILGQLSDRYGRRKLLALSIFGTSVSYLLFAVAIHTRNLPLMFFFPLY
jgi:DHA1 family tetracycline resistance protein-like MFS transporter